MVQVGEVFGIEIEELVTCSLDSIAGRRGDVSS